MDINKNQQINTFGKGMNTDTADSFIPADQYRYALNLRFTLNGESGSLTTISGYTELTIAFNVEHLTITKIIAATEIRNIGIIVCVGLFNGVNQEVWIAKKAETDSIWTVIFECEDSGWDVNTKLSLVANWESDTNIKLYIADGMHELMVVDLNPTTIPTSINDIIPTTSNATYAPPTVTVGQNTGYITAGKVQYCYQFYNEGGISSALSCPSIPVNVVNKKGGQAEGKQTSMSLLITIPGGTVDFQKIVVYRINHQMLSETPVVDVIYDNNYINSFVDYGSSLRSLSAAELLSINSVMRFKPKLIETKNNYLFASNVEYDLQNIDNIFKNSGYIVSITPTEGTPYTLDKKNNLLDDTVFKRSLRDGETYRYGIVYYTKDGRRTSVMNINDVGVVGPYLSHSVWDLDGNNFTIYPRGVHVRILRNTGTQAANELFAGFEVVRCKRDYENKSILYQGLAGFPVEQEYNSQTDLYNPGFLTTMYLTTRSRREYDGDTSDSVYSYITFGHVLFACPELMYDSENVKNMFLFKGLLLSKKYKIGTSLPGMNGKFVFDESESVLRVPTKAFGNKTDLRNYFETYILENNDDRITWVVNNNADVVQKTDAVSAFEIEDTAIAEIPEYNHFANEEGSLTNLSDVTVVDTTNFINWTPNPTQQDQYNKYINTGSADSFYTSGNLRTVQQTYPIARGGKLAVIRPEENSWVYDNGSFEYEDLQSNVFTSNSIPLVIANVTKTVTNPYGDSTNPNNIYCSQGNFSTSTDVDVFDGDCYVGVFEYNASYCWTSATVRATMMNTTYYVPIESDIDLLHTHGHLKSKDTSSTPYLISDKPVSYYGYSLKESECLYNNAYSTEDLLFTYSYINYTKVDNDLYDARILYSNQKTNGELIDSWLLFKSANFIDVDTRYGLITNMRTFKDTLLYWQESAAGALSVNERTIIQDANDHNIILGNGDVLQRYDYITTEYGMLSGDFSDALSNTALYWWDRAKKDIVMYQGGLAALPLKKAKTIAKFIDEHTSVTEPAVVYDVNNQEVLFNVVANLPLVYSELTQLFMGTYLTPFSHSITFDDAVLMILDNKIYTWDVGTGLNPDLLYVVNDNCTFVKTFDIVQLGGKFGTPVQIPENSKEYLPRYVLKEFRNTNMPNLTFVFSTPLNQTSTATRDDITMYENDYRLAVPRNLNDEFGGRMRGKTMQCELIPNSTDFLIDYIITKYRMSWG